MPLTPTERTLEPPVCVATGVVLLSAVDADFRAQRAAYLQRKQGRRQLRRILPAQ